MTHDPDHRRHERWENLQCGAIYAAVAAVTGPLFAVAYQALYAHGLASPAATRVLASARVDAPRWLKIAIAFAAYDFVYYLAHRASHGVALLHATHAVHHQARSFGLTVGARVGALSAIASYPFTLALAALGVPLSTFGALSLLHVGAMAWIHMERGPEAPILEWIFNTPRLHRIHHGAERVHQRRNLGGVFIVWDRLFGTFAPPSTNSVVASASRPQDALLGPIRANLLPFERLLRGFRRAGSKRAAMLAKVAFVQGTLAAALFAFVPAAARLPWTLALSAVILGVFTADLASGLLHWFMDCHAPRTGSVLSPVARQFDAHHDAPKACLALGFHESCFEGTFAILPLLACALVMHLPPFALAFIGTTSAALVVTPELHKMAHRRLPGVFGVAQRIGLLPNPRRHGRHHRRTPGRAHANAYCVTLGAFNGLFDAIGIWGALDRIVMALSRGTRGIAPTRERG